MDKINKKAVGARIKAIRLASGMTLREFGQLFGASKGSVQGWEVGRNTPNPGRLKKIAEFANISVQELLHGVKRHMYYITIAYRIYHIRRVDVIRKLYSSIELAQKAIEEMEEKDNAQGNKFEYDVLEMEVVE